MSNKAKAECKGSNFEQFSRARPKRTTCRACGKEVQAVFITRMHGMYSFYPRMHTRNLK